mmetsp:Transcript_38572/g.69029  ORF Transcript_38572/g.69029 Transcript_38572/m.69029 type:complete len:514 (-) Transcript_38572:3215-4756(-)
MFAGLFQKHRDVGIAKELQLVRLGNPVLEGGFEARKGWHPPCDHALVGAVALHYLQHGSRVRRVEAQDGDAVQALQGHGHAVVADAPPGRLQAHHIAEGGDDPAGAHAVAGERERAEAQGHGDGGPGPGGGEAGGVVGLVHVGAVLPEGLGVVVGVVPREVEVHVGLADQEGPGLAQLPDAEGAGVGEVGRDVAVPEAGRQAHDVEILLHYEGDAVERQVPGVGELVQLKGLRLQDLLGLELHEQLALRGAGDHRIDLLHDLHGRRRPAGVGRGQVPDLQRLPDAPGHVRDEGGLPAAGRLDHDQVAAEVDHGPQLHEDLRDLPISRGRDGGLHLHRLEHHHRVPLVDRVADLHLDVPDLGGDDGLGGHAALGQRLGPVLGHGRVVAEDGLQLLLGQLLQYVLLGGGLGLLLLVGQRLLLDGLQETGVLGHVEELLLHLGPERAAPEPLAQPVQLVLLHGVVADLVEHLQQPRPLRAEQVAVPAPRVPDGQGAADELVPPGAVHGVNAHVGPP